MTDTNTAISRSEITAAANSIEPLPAALSRLLTLLSSDDFDAAEVVEIMSHDAALAGDVLARANSAASGARRQIGELREATARVGIREIVNIAMRRAMRQPFAKPLPIYGLGPDDLWRHCIVASAGAEVVRKMASAPVTPMLATAALVHDVGKLVIAQCIPASFVDALLQAAEREAIPIHEAERLILGLDHSEVSGVVARIWGLPLSVQVALTQHHSDAGEDVFSDALILADKAAHVAEQMVGQLDESGSDPSDIDNDSLSTLIDSVGGPLETCGIAEADMPRLLLETAVSAGDILSVYAT